MRVEIEQDPALKSPEITIRCPAIDEDILRIVAMLRVQEQKVTGILDGDWHLLDAKSILYFESVDKRTFCYTRGAVYECPLRLYEIEEKLGGADFLRISKATVVNFRAIQSIHPDFGGRLTVTLENGERQCVSRQYAPLIRQKLTPTRRS